MPPMRNIFSGMKNAPVMNQGKYMGPGRYWYKIDKVKVAESAFKKKSFVAIETTVVRVLAPYPDIAVQPVGDESSQMMMDGDAISHQYFVSDVKKFLAGAYDCKPEEVDEGDICIAAGMKLDPASGMLIDDLYNVGGVVQQQQTPTGTATIYAGGTWVQKQPMRGMVLEYNNRPHTTSKNKVVTKHEVIREVPPAEVLAYFQSDPTKAAELERFFPGNFLQQKIANIAAQAGK